MDLLTQGLDSFEDRKKADEEAFRLELANLRRMNPRQLKARRAREIEWMRQEEARRVREAMLRTQAYAQVPPLNMNYPQQMSMGSYEGLLKLFGR